MIHNKKRIIWSVLQIFLIFSIIGCQSLKAGPVEEEAYIRKDNITYGKGGDIELKLDLACPASGKGPFPALVFIFGGSWKGGRRTQFYLVIREAAKRGYVAITVDYRLTSSVRENGKSKYPFPAQVYDVKCAVRWLRANAKKYKVDPNRIGTMGWSSGGHLALMLGLTDSSHGLEGECGDSKFSSRVQAVVSLAGATDLIGRYESRKWAIIDLLGGTPEEVPEQYRAASPVTYVSKDDPPVLSIRGAFDQPEQAEFLDAKMKEAGASHTLIIKKEAGHSSSGLWTFDKDNPVWDFFDKHLKGNL